MTLQLVLLLLAAEPTEPKKPVSPLSEMPATFTPGSADWDHERREVMIPMRDGAKLFTVILVPKGAKNAPMLLTRTPYDADKLTKHSRRSIWVRCSRATTTRPTSSSRAGTSAWCRTSAASTARTAIT